MTGRGGEMGTARLSDDVVVLGANTSEVRIMPPSQKKQPPLFSEGGCVFLTGRGGEIRTPDPHNPIVVRYQAALRPDRITCNGEGGQ